MKLKTFAYAIALGIVAWSSPVFAQTPQPQVSLDEILLACSQDRADTLPNPFRDVEPTHWAYRAVLSIYYCGPYRGSIPPEQYKQILERRSAETSQNLNTESTIPQ